MAMEFDSDWYVKRYPDVATAINAGKFDSALNHYERHGRAENRLPHAPPGQSGELPPQRRSYQTFPGEAGDSSSEKKFKSLQCPDFTGKSVLDVGCNEGYFCFKAAEQGAVRVLGLDQNSGFIEAARTRLQQSRYSEGLVEFLHQSWNHLPDEKFDMIFLLSALHYASDQAALIQSLTDHLTPTGVLILECGIIHEEHSDFVETTRAIDKVYFPTFGKIKEMFDGYAWKRIGPSISQAGDPVPREVFHIRLMKPTVILLTGKSYTGKTTLVRMLRKSGLPCIMVDDHVRVRAQQKDLDPRLAETLKQHYHGYYLDQLYAKMQQDGSLSLLIDDIVETVRQTDNSITIVEGAIGDNHDAQRIISNRFTELGYFVWFANSSLELEL